MVEKAEDVCQTLHVMPALLLDLLLSRYCNWLLLSATWTMLTPALSLIRLNVA